MTLVVRVCDLLQALSIILMIGSRVPVLGRMLAESKRRFCIQHGAELVFKGELFMAPVHDYGSHYVVLNFLIVDKY